MKVIFSAFYAEKITLSVNEQNINFVRTFRRFTCNALHIGRGDISISTKTNIFVDSMSSVFLILAILEVEAFVNFEIFRYEYVLISKSFIYALLSMSIFLINAIAKVN